MFFWLGFRMPLETLMELRGGRDGAANVAAAVHFLQLTPQGAATYQRILHNNKQRQDCLEDLTRLGRWPSELSLQLGGGQLFL